MRGPNIGTIGRVSREIEGRLLGYGGQWRRTRRRARKTARTARFRVASSTERKGGGVDEFWDLWMPRLALWTSLLRGGNVLMKALTRNNQAVLDDEGGQFQAVHEAKSRAAPSGGSIERAPGS
jgi:hypothetical protein